MSDAGGANPVAGTAHPNTEGSKVTRRDAVVWEERAIARLAAHIAGNAPGVERLDVRPPTRRGGRPAAVFGQGVAAGGAVTVSRAPDGSVDVAVRLVSRLGPAPVTIARESGAALREELQRVLAVAVRVEVAVTDVAP